MMKKLSLKHDLHIQEIIHLYLDEFWSLKEIGDHFHMSWSTVRNQLLKVNVQLRGCTNPRAVEKMKRALPDRTGVNNGMYGRSHSLKVRTQISTNRMQTGIARGKNNPNWKHGEYCTEDNTSYRVVRNAEMQTLAYREWRSQVFLRDDYTCQDCGKRGGFLQADHIKPWKYYPALRYILSNGRTLCLKCHRNHMKEVFQHELTLES